MSEDEKNTVHSNIRSMYNDIIAVSKEISKIHDFVCGPSIRDRPENNNKLVMGLAPIASSFAVDSHISIENAMKELNEIRRRL